jgi:hypothetical protein
MRDAAQAIGAERCTSRDDSGPSTYPATRRIWRAVADRRYGALMVFYQNISAVPLISVLASGPTRT